MWVRFFLNLRLTFAINKSKIGMQFIQSFIHDFTMHLQQTAAATTTQRRLWQCNYSVEYFLLFGFRFRFCFCSHFYNFISVCWRRCRCRCRWCKICCERVFQYVMWLLLDYFFLFVAVAAFWSQVHLIFFVCMKVSDEMKRSCRFNRYAYCINFISANLLLCMWICACCVHM